MKSKVQSPKAKVPPRREYRREKRTPSWWLAQMKVMQDTDFATKTLCRHDFGDGLRCRKCGWK